MHYVHFGHTYWVMEELVSLISWQGEIPIRAFGTVMILFVDLADSLDTSYDVTREQWLTAVNQQGEPDTYHSEHTKNIIFDFLSRMDDLNQIPQ